MEPIVSVYSEKPFFLAMQKLEFRSVLERIARSAVSDAGKRAILKLEPSVSPGEVTYQQQRVSEAKALLIQEGSIPLDGIRDIGASLKKSAVDNQVLQPTELLAIASTLVASRLLHAFLSKKGKEYTTLTEIVPLLFIDKVTEYNIQQAIDDDGRVRDSASATLAHVRRRIVSVQDELRKRLTQILRRVSEEEMLQDEIVTTRDGRLVIPVKSEFKKKVPGFIHSSSSSGATVFIEPAETLELNNSLREYQLEEIREIEKILRMLTDQVREIREPLSRTVEILADLDAVVAKAKYSIEVIGTSPRIAVGKGLRVTDARHPILLLRLPRSSVVPLSVELEQGASTLVITGPNAGGKTVALKTIGLLVLMVQCGIHLPAAPDSEMRIFDDVFVDIGDDQSIENDLSTFSSHLLNLKNILDSTTRESLVLIDEIGAGTDPAEGSALSAAILETLTRRGTYTIVTTHHGTLKSFAHSTDGIINGSMEFDQETLTPTYRFTAGIPGSSYAFELAERLGVPEHVIKNARSRLTSDEAALVELLVTLEKQKQRYAQLILEQEKNARESEHMKSQYESRLAGAKQEVKDIKDQAKRNAREIIRKASAQVERTIKEIKESKAEKGATSEARMKLKEVEQEVSALGDEEATAPPNERIVIGDSVKIIGTTSIGTVAELRGKTAIIHAGDARIAVLLEKLEKISRDTRASISKFQSIHYLPDAKLEIDLRGMMGDEAIVEVQHFMDQAHIAGLPQLRIIHGKGTGALRARVAEFLKSCPFVRTFSLAPLEQGGAGVTIVELKDE